MTHFIDVARSHEHVSLLFHELCVSESVFVGVYHGTARVFEFAPVSNAFCDIFVSRDVRVSLPIPKLHGHASRRDRARSHKMNMMIAVMRYSSKCVLPRVARLVDARHHGGRRVHALRECVWSPIIAPRKSEGQPLQP